ncbi:hypothetical protein ACO0OL_003699 [Hanseniaspora opuntiae]
MTNHQDINNSYHCNSTSSYNSKAKENQEPYIFKCFDNLPCKDFDLLKFAEAQLIYLNIKFLRSDLEEFKDRINELTSDSNAIFLNPTGSSSISNRLFHNDLMVEKLMHESVGFSECVTFLENFESQVFDDSLRSLNSEQTAEINYSTSCQCVCKYTKVCAVVYLIYSKSICTKEEPTLSDLLYTMSLNYTDPIHSHLIEPTEKEELFMQEILGFGLNSNKELENLNDSLSQLTFKGNKRLSLASEYSISSNNQDDLFNPNQTPVWMPDKIHELYFVYRSMEDKCQDPYIQIKTKEVHKILKNKNCKIYDHKRRKLFHNDHYTHGFNIKDYEKGKYKIRLDEDVNKDPYNAVVENILDSLLQ